MARELSSQSFFIIQTVENKSYGALASTMRCSILLLLLGIIVLNAGCSIRSGPTGQQTNQLTSLVIQSIPGPEEGVPINGFPSPSLERAWALLLNGDFSAARESFERVNMSGGDSIETSVQAFALAGLGWCELTFGKFDDASSFFQSSLEKDPSLPVALHGMAVHHRVTGNPLEGYRLLEELHTRFPDSIRIQMDAEKLKMEAVEKLLSCAETADEEGNCALAVESYLNASELLPTVPGLKGKLAGSLEKCGDTEQALAVLEAAVRSSTGDDILMMKQMLADLELRHGDPARATLIYRQLVEEEPERSDLAELLKMAEAELMKSTIPTQYRDALSSAGLTRGELAAIVEMETYSDGNDPSATGGRTPVMKDISGHWARTYIQKTVGRGLMDVFSNHTFRPDERVDRSDLASLACRLLDQRQSAEYPGFEPVRTTAPAVSDLSREHRQYDCVRALLSLDLLASYPDNTVRLNGAVSGREALDLISALQRLDLKN